MGILTLVSRFEARTLLVFWLCASVPFFVFNAWFVFVNPMFTGWMALDFAESLGFFAIGLAGLWLMRHEREPV